MNYKFLILLLLPFIIESNSLTKWASKNKIKVTKKLKYSDVKKEFKVSYYIVLGDELCSLTDIEGINNLEVVLPDKTIEKITNIPNLSINLIYGNINNKLKTVLENLFLYNNLNNLNNLYINGYPIDLLVQIIMCSK